jgi:hypothetical protein
VPRLATQIPKALRGFVDGSCIHVDRTFVTSSRSDIRASREWLAVFPQP